MSDATDYSKRALVYLFGAGASYPCLPLAKDVSRRMIHWGQLLQTDGATMGKPEYLSLSSQLLEWGTAGSSHHSVDTLAKKLYLNNQHEDLYRLKAAMSAYFMLEQATTPAEKRYDSFFASILETPGNPPLLPPHIWFVTWNYDLQLEKAYHQYCHDVRLVQDNITFNKKVVRLNGLLGRGFDKGTGDEYNLDLSADKGIVFSRVLTEYQQLLAHHPTITFGFEGTFHYEEGLRPLSSLRCTLVVIGYSFPYFNRQIDKTVLSTLGTVDAVFLQALPEHTALIASRMRALRDFSSIEVIPDMEQFFVPYAPV